MDESVSTIGIGSVESSAIVFHSNPSVLENEMLRVSKDGFYVRGKKVPVDDKEAETVYNAFKKWLVEAELRRPW